MSNENVLKFSHNEESTKSRNWFRFFSTSSGRKFVFNFIGATAIGISAAITCKETLLISYYLDFIRAYRNGLPLEVPEELEKIVDKASEKLKYQAREAPYLKTLMICGFDIKSFGTVNSNYNGWIGLPINYLYNSRHDIDRLNIKIQNEPIDWNNKYGELLEKSLILTEDEKLFGIARTAQELRNYNHIHSTLIPGGVIVGLYTTAQAINKKYNLYAIPRPGRIIVYSLLSIFAYGVYSFITDTIHIQQAVSVDKALVELGSDMIEAGIRFYEKVLNKNIAIRELSGKDLYSVKGNEYPGLLRMRTLPLTTRKLFLETCLEEVRKKEAEEAAKQNETETKSESDQKNK